MSVLPGVLSEFIPNADSPSDGQRQAKLLLIDFSSVAALTTAPSLSRRRRYTLDAFGADPKRGRNVVLKVSGTSSLSRPKIFHVGVSYSIQPDTTMGRFTNWDSGSSLADKYVKGIIIECDTFGVSRDVEIQGDGAVKTTLKGVKTSGRQVLQFSFQQFRARLLRLRSLGSGKWMLYRHQWIFDEEPLALERWETQPSNHGIPEWQTPCYGDIAYSADAPLVMELTAFDQQGQPTMRSYELGATAGGKRSAYVQFFATQGVLFKYAFASAGKFYLYREESTIWVQPWGGEKEVPVHPFGNDDLDLVRSMQMAELTAARGGGGRR